MSGNGVYRLPNANLETQIIDLREFCKKNHIDLELVEYPDGLEYAIKQYKKESRPLRVEEINQHLTHFDKTYAPKRGYD